VCRSASQRGADALARAGSRDPARRDHIQENRTPDDFGSILKFIETTFQLTSLGYADTAADDLADCFDLTHSPSSFHPIAARLDAAFFLNDRRPAVAPDDD
jgi:hypothetical protein